MPSRFKYPLSSLKRLRQLKLDMAKADLAAVSANLSEVEGKIVESQASIGDLLTDSRQTNDMLYVKLFSELSSVEKDKIRFEMKKRELIQSEFERHTNYVSFLNSEFKAVELHEKSKKEDFDLNQKRNIEKTLDEVVSIIHGSKSKDES